MKDQCVAMLLAGGKGSRLNALTKHLAKPAVPFGGKYRIIDFALSNCTNSGIHHVGVLTQYQPLLLNSYIGIGETWDLDRNNGGVAILSPYAEASEVKWYKGTASAIYENRHFLKERQPEHVLILSGDHIYKMDYGKMLEYHIEKQADATIAVIEVNWAEAGRFGILHTNDQMDITYFEEKPKYPKSNLASMGVYIFKWSVLEEALEQDEKKMDSSHDFGKDIIPALLHEKKKLNAYPFQGYWKDVGTIRSLWEANMDLLGDHPALDLFERNWRIYSVTPDLPPQFIAEQAEVKESLISEGCAVYGAVARSVVFQGVSIGRHSKIKHSVIMHDAEIGDHVELENAIVPPGMRLPDGFRAKSENDEVLLITEEFVEKHKVV
ncbi:glucose-1-phosphate adenylyltransferase [Bacillus swezeyi]|uniref:Glucose-1-phosphate adenylyltransferase n=1 Tax=Bacillus swezeyi TaxID=1925020 RepID=A0A1R1RWK3_9BACI|nr:glucose-1-phosphate adenylyltransferase [Bacillus swezeyi]MEC1261968.1 glucose-1-phosphate adenylyltransferase [Bacillus swezeyi]MED2930535.1 glucose-1-phosphate adenylyltransferase [Bacillus swezeyi]MED2944510.1 glucose-1-phosphate adenylyltransferase [Bacillus swezeyi]MED2963859.1 glucose-1-phosphate adenylyltransferase [Bacillus swezeyi]MED2975111.1 glucose-1-phosphate adenylyltransferase [Bacillus swezeyi]